MINQLRNAFDRFVVLEDSEWQRVEDIITIKQYKKGDYFIKEDEQCPYVGYTYSGLFRYYYLIDGQQHTRQFFFSNNFMANYQSYITACFNYLL